MEELELDDTKEEDSPISHFAEKDWDERFSEWTGEKNPDNNLERHEIVLPKSVAPPPVNVEPRPTPYCATINVITNDVEPVQLKALSDEAIQEELEHGPYGHPRLDPIALKEVITLEELDNLLR